MGIFSHNNDARFLGVDMGAGGIKLVECAQEKGTPRLTNYAYSQEPLHEAGTHDIRDDVPQCAALLQDMLRKAHMKTSNVVASLPTFSVFSSIITIEKNENQRKEDLIKEKAKRIIPLPLEEMVLDWKILPPPNPTSGATPVRENVIQETPTPSIRVLVTAAQRKLVSTYISIFKAAKLNLVSLETEAFALIRSLVGNDHAALMIVDMGALTTDISVVHELTPVLDGSLDMGGVHISRELSKVLSVNLSQSQ